MRKMLLLYCFLHLFFFSLISATAAASAEVEEKGSNWTLYFRPGVRFGTDDRILYILDFLVPLYQGKRNILFFNPKFSPNNQDGCEVNLGLGYRHLLFDDRLVLGLNGFYDTRRTDGGGYHRQWGVGAEVMTELPVADTWDLGVTGRFNYYKPLTSARIRGAGGALGYFFQDHAIFSRGGTVEVPLGGFDAEVGVRIPYVSDLVETWFYAGGYHFEGSYVDNIDGFMARVELLPTDFMRVNYEYRKDRTTSGDHYGEVCLEFPFSVENLMVGKNPFAGFGSILQGSRKLKERLVEPVRRDVDIVVAQEIINTGAMEGWVADVVFVAEDPPDALPADRDGSFEHPYGSLDEALTAANSPVVTSGVRTIHIMNNSGTDTVPRCAPAITLDNLLLWGSGAPHPTYGWIQNQYAGFPTIVSDTSAIYALRIDADDVEITGISILGTTLNAFGIYFIPPRRGISLHHNLIAVNESTSASVYFGATSNSSITNNVINNYGSGLSGITFWATSGNVENITISNNVISSGREGIRLQTMSVMPVSSITGITISDNELQINAGAGNAYGIYLFNPNSGTIDADISGNYGTIIAGGTNRFLYVAGVAGTVNWGGIGTGPNENNVTPIVAWDGNYPALGGPVQENFLGTLNP